MAKKDTPPVTTTDEKLDEIVEILHTMDRRDKLRTWGGFLHGLFSMIPIILLLWSAWYFYQHGDEVLRKITKQAAEEAGRMTQERSEGFMEQFQEYFPQGQ